MENKGQALTELLLLLLSFSIILQLSLDILQQSQKPNKKRFIKCYKTKF